jgi:hypothetical protein
LTEQVKFQFSSGDVEFDALSLNGVSSFCAIGSTLGCTDPLACNYDPLATVDDGSCSADGIYTLSFFDSFGDGWNGNTFDITDANSVVVYTGTLASGSSGTESFCLADGCYTVEVGGGSWASEISYSLADGLGTVLLSGSNVLAPTALCVPEVYGCTDPMLCGYDPLATVDDGSCGDAAYTLTMNDSWGDGWNGNTFDVVDASGTIISSSTLSSWLPWDRDSLSS